MQHTSIALQQSNHTYRVLIPAVFFALLIALAARPAYGQEGSGWATGAHFGYAVNQESSTGFKNVGGSLMFLDLIKSFGSDLEVGMRTIAQGGQESRNEYYRMGAGPLLSYRINDRWRAQFSLSFFNETANDESREQAYKSRGRTYQLGWERCRELMKNVELAWGGFYMLHQGNISLSDRAASSNTASTRFSGISTNQGTTRGVEVALRFKL